MVDMSFTKFWNSNEKSEIQAIKITFFLIIGNQHSGNGDSLMKHEMNTFCYIIQQTRKERSSYSVLICTAHYLTNGLFEFISNKLSVFI